MEIADFRSDTLTRPDAAMREAMATAEVGDDVFGEDPTVAALQEEAAAWLGQEAALFVPSGTMANQIAIHVHCRPGDELLCEERSHVFMYEGGSVARLSGTQCRLFAADSGFPTPDQLQGLLRADDPHFPRSRLLVLENSHNMAGGQVLDRKKLGELLAWAHAQGLLVHVDGARLANAAVACATPADQLVEGVDSVSLCFSKGLGAPVGSVIAGSAAFVAAAHRVRKALGGGMRQVGILAAAARLALREGPERLVVDHARARHVGVALAEVPSFRLDLGALHSNILMLDLVDASGPDLLSYLGERGIRALAVGPQRVRFVFHRDLIDSDIERLTEACLSWAGQRS